MSSRSGHHQVTTIIGVGIICMTIVSFIYLARSGNGNGSGRSQPDLDLDTQLNYRELQSTYAALSKQYESLYEYKERLEKSYLVLKNEKAALIENDKNEKVEFTELKELYSKQVQTLQDELKTCQEHLHSFVLSSKNTNAANAAAVAAQRFHAGDPSSADAINNELYKTHDHDGGGGSLSQSLRLPILTASQSPFNQDSAAALPQPDFPAYGYGDKNKSPSPLPRHKSSGVSSQFSGGAGLGQAASVPLGSHVRVAIDNSIASNVLKEPIQSPIAQVPMEPQQPSSDPNQDIAGNVLI